MVRFLAGVDLNNVHVEQPARGGGNVARPTSKPSANEHKLGAKIIFVGLQDIHPPTTVAGDYEKVIGAEQTKLATILAAQAYAISTIALAGAQAFTTTNLADATRQQLEVSALRAGGAVHQPDSGVRGRAVRL